MFLQLDKMFDKNHFKMGLFPAVGTNLLPEKEVSFKWNILWQQKMSQNTTWFFFLIKKWILKATKTHQLTSTIKSHFYI